MRNDFRLAARTLIRRPVLSSALTLTIGLAVAAATVAFAVVNGVLLRPLPYAEPERLASIWEKSPRSTFGHNPVAPSNFLAWKDELRTFDRIAATVVSSGAVTGDGEPEQVGINYMSATYFGMVGAAPVVGRFYTEAEDIEGGPRVVVLSEGYWRRRYGADPAIVGKNITMNGVVRQVVGVLPTRFDFTGHFRATTSGQTRDLWIPPQFRASDRSWGGRYLSVVGRLAPGTMLTLAQKEATAVAVRLAQRFPDRLEGWGITVIPLHEQLVGDVRTALLVVFGAVVFVLLIACSNVASLLLTRATERQAEMAVRAALGAGSARLFSQLLAESLVLAATGGAIGLGLADIGIRALVASAPDLPRIDAVSLDWNVIGFALGAVLGAAALFGLAPALQLGGRQLTGWLTQRGASGRRQAYRARSLFVGAQITLSFVLLVGAGLLIRSLINRLGLRLGFETENLVTAEVTQFGPKMSAAERAGRFDQIAERVAAAPGVERASAGSEVPMNEQGHRTTFEIVGRPAPSRTDLPTAEVRFVRYDYTAALGIPLLAGRSLGPEDHANAPLAVLINETGARVLWPGESPLGKRIRMEWGDTLNAEVVGVVGDVRLNGLDDQPIGTTLYWDHRQAGQQGKMVLVVRTKAPAGTVLPAIRAAVREVDPNLPLYNIRTMDELLSKVVARARFTTVALGLFASLALILAALGLYGVMAYATQQREREIGIRMALGADRRSVVQMVLTQGLAVVGPALALGATFALGLSRLLRTLVFGVSPADPATFAGVAVLLAISGLVACWLPARRASGIDPVIAIRAE